MTGAGERRPARVVLRGLGLWTPAFPARASWVAAGMPELGDWASEQALDVASEQAPPRPAAELLAPRLRRRTSVLTRAVATAAAAAAGQAGLELARARLLTVSSYGEIATTVELLDQLATPEGPVSPTKFHNSVHNTATGYLSIATKNRGESTALAAGAQGLAIGLLEVATELAAGSAFGSAAGSAFGSASGAGQGSVLILAEEQLPAPFDRREADPTYALALALAAEPAGLEQVDSLDLAVDLELGFESGGPSVTDEREPSSPLGSPLVWALGLARAAIELAAGPSGGLQHGGASAVGDPLTLAPASPHSPRYLARLRPLAATDPG